MHIPDGYLSPSSCAVLYGASVPFWSVALRRVRTALSGRTIPRLSVFAAFSFVVMMFNLPLPGGTTGHATGIAIAAIVLGPWGGIIATSIALFIQALFFGDGGILTFGANAFNMAIAGTIISYGCYRLLTGRAATSRRRVVAAALAGYAGMNVSALLAAIELGLQPILFHDAHGAPLYAPYALSIAVPAMMAGHLLIAGVAEALLTGGVVAYLQKSAPALIAEPRAGSDASVAAGSRGALRPLWLAVAVLMILSPFGLISAGTAWGEWRPADFSHPEQRAAIAIASANVSPPALAPEGMRRLSSIWTAPLSGYAPEFLKSEAVGYLFSAMVGVGFLLLVAIVVNAATHRSKGSAESLATNRG